MIFLLDVYLSPPHLSLDSIRSFIPRHRTQYVLVHPLRTYLLYGPFHLSLPALFANAQTLVRIVQCFLELGLEHDKGESPTKPLLRLARQIGRNKKLMTRLQS